MTYLEVSRLLAAPELHEALKMAGEAEKAARHLANHLDEIRDKITEAEDRLAQIEERCRVVDQETNARREQAKQRLAELTLALDSVRQKLN